MSQNTHTLLFQTELIFGILEELFVTLEELQTSTEKLQQQNQELIATRQEAEREHQRYKDLFEAIPDGYLVTNHQGVILEANRAAAKLFQVKKNFLMGKPLILFVANEDHWSYAEKLNQLRSLQNLKNWETCLKPQQGESFLGLLSASTRQSEEGNSLELCWLIRNISKQKEAEDVIQEQLTLAKELSELRSRLIRTVSHEYRTPLSRIVAAAFLMANCHSPDQEETKERCHKIIKASVKEMNQLLEDAILLNKGEVCKLEFNPTLINVEEFCRSLIEEETLLEGNERVVHFQSQGQCNSLYLDEELLYQILVHLFSNAFKYSPSESDVNFKLICEKQWVQLEIQDSGMGILPEDQPYLFEPFHRGKNVGTIPGTGLGLAIIKRAVDLHKGNIKIESEVGIGTTFTVTLNCS